MYKQKKNSFISMSLMFLIIALLAFVLSNRVGMIQETGVVLAATHPKNMVTAENTTYYVPKESVKQIPIDDTENDDSDAKPIIWSENSDGVDYEVKETMITNPTEPKINETYNSNYLGVFTLTAYCSCSRCCGSYALNRPLDENGNQIVYTAIGAIAQPNHTIAVDPSVIPYGTEVSINGNTYVAEDCGGGVNGYHIDVYFDNHDEALAFGRQSADVYLVS